MSSSDGSDAKVDFSPTLIQRMISSCCGALLVSLFVSPLDVVKIKLQAQEKDFLKKNKCFLFCNGLMDHICFCDPNSKHTHPIIQSTRYYSGTVDAFRKIIKYDGVKTLWSGLSPTLVTAVPNTVIYFTAYDLFLENLKKSEGRTEVLAPIAGGSARLLAVSIVSPLELIRIRMQFQAISYKGVHLALKDLIAHEGVKGLWRGLSSSIWRDVPFSVIYWPLLEKLKSLYNGGKDLPVWYTFMSGASAGVFAGVVTLPFDVIKTHRQIELGTIQYTKKVREKPKSLNVLLRELYQQRGIRSLFAGIVPRIVKVAPACAIMISVYDYAKAFFSNYNKEQYIQEQQRKKQAQSSSNSQN